MTIGLGRTADGVAITPAMKAGQITSATIYYNGQSITTGAGWGFDAQPYEDCLVQINVGTIQGPLCTLLNSVLESDTDDPTQATHLASFTTKSGAASVAHQQVGSIKTKDAKRYLFLKTEAQGTTITANFSANFVGGQLREQPPAANMQTLVFDV